MHRLYRKNGILFAILWIVAYVVLLSGADNLSVQLGIEKCVTLPLCAVIAALLYGFLKKHSLQKEYGLCKSRVSAGRLLYYIPLAAMASINLWYGAVMQLSLIETVLYVLSMMLVGFLEEMIFRGLLFCEMRKSGLISAIIVSSVTFGIGHLVNLFNGSGASLMASLLQVVYAVAAGFLFTILFHKTGSLWPCIVTHSILNSLSVFANEAAMTTGREIFTAVILTVLSLGYAVYILWAVKKEET